MSETGLEAVSDARVVGRPSRMSLSGDRPFWMSGSCQEALSVDREWSEDPPG